jgi:hypothetical protein
MNADAIVRLVAEIDAGEISAPVVDGSIECVLCGSRVEVGRPLMHARDCVWLLACEWVADHPTVPADARSAPISPDEFFARRWRSGQ